MRCIFCKLAGTSFSSVEHIIPQSIGNIEHTLPKGIVCDNCNNYFSRKVESQFINSEVILDIRHEMNIQNKRGRIPSKVHVTNKIQMPEQRIVARFLGKVALEVLTQRAIVGKVKNWPSEIIDKKELDPIRNFSRFNLCEENWPFYHRTLHPVNAIFSDSNEQFEVLHEYDLLYTKRNELYLILSIFGVEFAINMAGPTIDGYKQWLQSNEYISPLYTNRHKHRV